MLSSSASSDASASRNCSRPRNSLFWLRSTSHRTHSSGRETPPTERTEHTEPSGREIPPTDWHGCAQIRRVWHPAIPTQPAESSSISSTLPPARARTAPTKQAGISPTERTERTEPSGREVAPTDSTDLHRCRRVWHPAIPTQPPESSIYLCGRTDATKPSVQIREIRGRINATNHL